MLRMPLWDQLTHYSPHPPISYSHSLDHFIRIPRCSDCDEQYGDQLWKFLPLWTQFRENRSPLGQSLFPLVPWWYLPPTTVVSQEITQKSLSQPVSSNMMTATAEETEILCYPGMNWSPCAWGIEFRVIPWVRVVIIAASWGTVTFGGPDTVDKTQGKWRIEESVMAEPGSI